ncbi:MAG TPA: ankyrin repeat domain-containing protein [Candidatus Methylacidiphilales bacterium]|nr:ankyrin repeat domain-containing protein [Candidatus Methylacidiphilales bacterium]
MRLFYLAILFLAGLLATAPVLSAAQTEIKTDVATAEALHKACDDGDLEKVKELVAQGAAVDSSSGKYKFTPLTAAAGGGHLEVLKFLLENKANPDLADIQGSTPLLHACWNDKTECALALMEAGANVSQGSKDKRTPLMYAAHKGNDKIVAALIARKVRLDDNCDSGPAVTWAASASNLSTLKLLVEAGAKLTLMPAKARPDIYSIMARAAEKKDVAMINYLVEQKVDINTPSADGGTALFAATKYADARTIDRLVELGININAQNNEGDTALMSAKDETNAVLLKHRPNLEIKNKKGRTALMVAAGDMRTDSVRALVDAGADINAADLQGETALTIAGNIGNVDAVEFLKSKGAQKTELHIIPKGDPDPAITPARAWAIAVGMYYVQMNDLNPRVLGGGKRSARGLKVMLERDWGIKDRKSLISQLDDMRDAGHHKSYQEKGATLDKLTDKQFDKLLAAHPKEAVMIHGLRNSYRKWKERTGLAWDICRSANLINSGYAVRFINEQEAWTLLMANARLAQKSFSSWQELNDNFLDGREIWANSRSPRFEAFAKLFLNPNDPNSPWNQCPWTTELSAPEPAPAPVPAPAQPPAPTGEPSSTPAPSPVL